MSIDLFTAYQALVGLIGAAIVWELSHLRSDLKDMSEKLQNYAVEMEGRVSRVEAQLDDEQ